MGDPITHLSPELVREHPALTEFARFIQERYRQAPNPSRIEVNYEYPHDGIVSMNFVGGDGTYYVAQINAPKQLMQLRFGRLTNRIVQGNAELQFDPPETRKYFDQSESIALCRTVKFLGGDQEANAPCSTSPSGALPGEPEFWGKTSWMGGVLIGHWSLKETLRWISRRPALTWSQRGQMGGSAAAGLLAYNLGAFTLSDILGLHPAHHTHERFALGAGMGYGAYRGVHHLLGRRMSAGLRPFSFSTGLITAALLRDVLATTPYDTATSSLGVAGVGLFLPAIRLRTLNRPVGRRAQAVGRWANRIILGGFLADAGYMGINYLSNGSSGSALNNRIYAEANRRAAKDRGFVSSLGHGVAHLLAPSLTERFLVGDSYVSQAREGLRSEAGKITGASRPFLRRALVFGPAGHSLDPNFYSEFNWDWLRGDNTLRDIRLPDGRELPVTAVAEQLNDPEIYRRVVEGSSMDEQISYIRHQFRGYQLTRDEAREILDRIALHQMRASLSELELMVSPSDNPMAGLFDGHGALKPGQEGALIEQVLPGHHAGAEQILALRRVSLALRIMELQNTGASATSLASYTAVARQIGLMDETGNFADREEVALARNEFQGRLAYLPTPPSSQPTRAQLIREFMTTGISRG